MTDTQFAFGRLDVLLAHAAADLSTLAPIAFQVLDANETWGFDPTAPGRRFTPGEPPRPALTVRLNASALVRWVTEASAAPADPLQYAGDLGCLARLADVLAASPAKAGR